MDGSFTNRRGTSPFAARCTTLLASLWGAVAAYILCHSLIVTHNKRYTVAALVSLVTVWATLERKRWGRMALIGLSVTTMGVFGFFVGAFSAFSDSSQSPEVRSMHKAMMKVANCYGISIPGIIALLLLAVVSSLWLCRAEVVAEFNQHKHALLVSGQRVIATTLVACWGAAIALNPMLPFEQSHAQTTQHFDKARPRNDAGDTHAAANHDSQTVTRQSGHNRNMTPSRSLVSRNRR
jgi:hypothetical protein